MAKSTAHTAITEPSETEWVVTRNGTEVARSTAVVLVRETYQGRDLGAVPYFPRADVVALIGPSSRATRCPVKGDASYYAIDGDPGTEDGIWSYATPMSPLEGIAGYVSFYGDRFEIARVG